MSTGTATADSTPDLPWLSNEQQREWRALAEVLALLPPALDAQLKRDGGVNSYEFHVLASLAEAPGRTLGLSDLAQLAQGSLSRLSHALTRLERSDWVARRTCAERRGRHMQATLTDAGFAKLEEVAPGHVREVRRLVVDVLTPEQLEALGDAARAISAAIAAGCAEATPDVSGC